MDWTLITILGGITAWCGFLVWVMTLIQRAFTRDRARQERKGVKDSYTS